MKRFCDFVVALLALLVTSPLLVFIALSVWMTSRGPILFCQERVGRGFRRFRIFKFRSMVQDAPSLGTAITVGDDSRITGIGRILRSSKLDELPQLFNVLLGNMSFVGPRPEVPKYVEILKNEYQEVLQVRPGITDLASIKFRNESAILAEAEDPEQEYIQQVLPEKIRLAKEYVRDRSLWLDLKIIVYTLSKLCGDRFNSSKRVARSPQSAVLSHFSEKSCGNSTSC